MLIALDISPQMWSQPLSDACCGQFQVRAVAYKDWLSLKKVLTLPLQFDAQALIAKDKLHAVLFLAGEPPDEILIHPDGVKKLTKKILKRLRKDAGFDC